MSNFPNGNDLRNCTYVGNVDEAFHFIRIYHFTTCMYQICMFMQEISYVYIGVCSGYAPDLQSKGSESGSPRYHFIDWVPPASKNKTHRLLISNNHPLATANKARHCLKWGAGVQNQKGKHIILTKFEAVHPTVVSEYYSSSGMLTIHIMTELLLKGRKSSKQPTQLLCV